MDEEGGGKGEKREKGASSKDDGSVGMRREGEQHWLTGKSNAGGGERDPFDLEMRVILNQISIESYHLPA